MFLQLNQRTQRRAVLLLFRPTLLLAVILGTVLALMDGAAALTGGINDKLLHAAGFAVLAFLLDYSFPNPRSAFWRWQLPLLLLYGILIEAAQSSLSHRSAEVLDVVADLCGLLAYGAARPLLARIWRPRLLPS